MRLDQRRAPLVFLQKQVVTLIPGPETSKEFTRERNDERI